MSPKHSSAFLNPREPNVLKEKEKKLGTPDILFNRFVIVSRRKFLMNVVNMHVNISTPQIWRKCNSLSRQAKSIRDKGADMNYIYGM